MSVSASRVPYLRVNHSPRYCSLWLGQIIYITSGTLGLVLLGRLPLPTQPAR